MSGYVSRVRLACSWCGLERSEVDAARQGWSYLRVGRLHATEWMHHVCSAACATQLVPRLIEHGRERRMR